MSETEIPETWQRASLAETCIAIRDGSHGTHKRVKEGVPFLSAKNITNSGEVVWNKEDDQISEADYQILSRAFKLRAHDLLMTIVGSIGRCALFDGSRVTFQRSVAYIRPDSEKARSRYLLHAMSAEEFQRQLTLGTNATAQAGIYLGELAKKPLLLPPLWEQTRIAEILDTLDEAIREAEAMIVKLRQLKAGLLHDLLTRGLDEHGHLRDPIRHPDQFQNSPLGLIPKAWRVMRLHQLAEVERGKFTARPRNDPRFFEGGSFPFAQTGDVAAAAGDYLHYASQSLNESGVRISRRFPAETVLITIAANIGDAALLGAEMFVTDSVVGAVAREDTDPRFVLMSMLKLKPQLKAVAPQSAQANINLEILRPLQIATPSYDEQMKITNCYFSVSQRLKSEQEVLCKLQEVKRGLSNDLLNGRKRVTT